MSWRGDESGQGMAEFALVLPMLALLTFGTIEVAIYLQQQSTLNAAAFLAARSASVLANESGPTKQAAEKFAQEAGEPWLHEAVSGMKADHAKDRSRFTLTAKTDQLSGMIDALTNGESKGLDKLSAQATLPLEYEHKKFGEKTPTSLRRSMHLFSYDSKNWLPVSNPAALAQANIERIEAPLRKIAPTLTVTLPTPKPTPAPQQPSGGSGNGPRPKVIETPHPHVSADPHTQGGKFVLQVPFVGTVAHFDPGTGEPFRTVGAVIPNPHHVRNAGDSDVTGSDYVAPLYERHFRKADPSLFNLKDPKYRIQNLLDELDQYAKSLNPGAGGQPPAGMAGKLGIGQLYPSCTGVGLLPLNHAPLPKGTVLPPAAAAAVDAAWKKAVVPSLTAARKISTTMAKGMVDGSQRTYKEQLATEKRLFTP